MTTLQPLGSMIAIYSKHENFDTESIKAEFKAGMHKISAQVHASLERGDIGLSNSEIEGMVAVSMSRKLHFYSESMSSIRQNYIRGFYDLEHAVTETNAVMAKLTALRQFFGDLTSHGMTLDQRDVADEKVAGLQITGFIKLQDVAVDHNENIAFIPARGGIVVA